jgi:hypothetical protein
MNRRARLACIGLFALAACAASRPPWADGAVIRSEIPAGAAAQDLSLMAERLLAAHNRERSLVGVPLLQWDPLLAQQAASYAAELERVGRLVHSPRGTRPGQGENLWMGTRGAFSLDEMIGSWSGEKSLFRPGLFPDVSSTGLWPDVSHYTQMIWRSTTRVGCAVHRGRSEDYLVCRYSPNGNVTGQRVP